MPLCVDLIQLARAEDSKKTKKSVAGESITLCLIHA